MKRSKEPGTANPPKSRDARPPEEGFMDDAGTFVESWRDRAEATNRIDDRWNAAVLDARHGWLPRGCDDLARLTRDEWDDAVLRAEERWDRVGELKGEVTAWYAKRNDDAGQTRDGDELVFFAGDQRVTKNGWECSMLPITDLVAMAVPLTLAQIRAHGEGKELDERTLRLNPIFGAIYDQHHEHDGRRRAARETIAAHFAMVVGEPLAMVEETGGRTMPGASIVKTMVLKDPEDLERARRSLEAMGAP